MSPYLEQMAQLEEELHEAKEENLALSQRLEGMSGQMHRYLELINNLQGVESQRDDMRNQLTKALEDNARLYKENKELKGDQTNGG
jgi:uncharacterized protein Yka (UPF0111/DUF47 family)